MGVVRRERIEVLIAALESLDDPRAREPAQQLLGLVLELHRAGIARLLELVDDAGDPDGKVIERLLMDEAVTSLLLLHGLHPHDLESRVRSALDKLRTTLGAQSIRIELLHATEEGVRVKVTAMSMVSTRDEVAEVRREIESAVLAQAPDVAIVEIEGLPTGEMKEIRFMPWVARTSKASGAAP